MHEQLQPHGRRMPGILQGTPNLEATNQVYEGIPDYLRSFSIDERDMTKYVIGTMSDVDTPLHAPSLREPGICRHTFPV